MSQSWVRYRVKRPVLGALLWASACLTVASSSCSQRSTPDKVAGWLVQLSGSDAAKRKAATRKLSDVKNDPRLLLPFARLLLDKHLRNHALPWFEVVGMRAIGASPWISELARGKVHPKLGAVRGKPDSKSREMAIKILGHIGGPRACDTLVELLEDRGMWPRARDSLRKLGTACMPAMVVGLAHDSKRRVRVFNIMANFGLPADRLANSRPRPVDAFLAALPTPLVEARRRLIALLMKHLQARVTTALVAQLEHSHWKVRMQALKSLGHPRRKLTPVQLAAIRKMLADPDVDVLAQAARVCSDRKDRLAEKPLLKLYKWRPVKVPGYAHSEREHLARLHGQVAAALIAIKSEQGFLAVVARLSAGSDHGDYMELGRSKDRRAFEPLLAALKRAKSEYALEQILEALGLLGFAEARPALERRLQHKKMRVRWAAVRALKTLGDAKAIPALLRRLKDPAYQVRTATLDTLERYAGPTLVPRLCELLNKTKGVESTLENVVRVLRKSKSPKATGCLITALGLYEKDKRFQYNYVLKRRIIEALGEVADTRAIDALIRRLKPPPKRPTRPTGDKVAAPLTESPIVMALHRLAKRHPASVAKIERALKGRGQ